MNQYDWPPVLDGTFLRDHGANQIAQGKFARVPILIGTNSDEASGLASAVGKVNTDDDFRRVIRGTISPTAAENLNKSTDAILDEALYVYPDVQRLGVPSLTTWPHVLRPGDAYAQEVGLQFRRRNAFVGDLLFGYLRRRANLAWSRYGVSSFAYRFDVTVNGVAAMLGAIHFQEAAFVFHNVHGNGYDINPFGDNATQYNHKARALADTMCAQWINFIADLDPNDHAPAAKTVWPVFTPQDGGGVGRSLVYGLDGPSVEWDDVRAEGMNWFMENDLGLVGN
ncbi:hypothetical protein E4U53_003773 [Claviceps sorghi]|nr:hypothetical protein E4U53_003773 [Claviceps sorghi]